MTSSEPNDTDLDPLLQQAVQALRAPVVARPAARDALAAAIAGATPTPHTAALPMRRAGARRPVRWFTTARTIRMSPAGMLAAAALLVVTTAAITTRRSGGAPVAASGPAAPMASPDAQVVRFSLAAPQASRVSLVGDFNGWDPTATALRQLDGTWTVVIPVTPGRHQYGFVVDGTEWIADPAAARTADSDFGTANSVVYVGS